LSISDARHTDGADHRTQITAPTRTLVSKPDDGSRSRGRHPQRRSTRPCGTFCRPTCFGAIIIITTTINLVAGLAKKPWKAPPSTSTPGVKCTRAARLPAG